MADKIKPNMQKAIDSEIERQRKDIEEKGGKAPKARGTYDEAPGGGTPAKGGGRGAMKGNFEVVNNKEEADAIRKEDPNAKIRYNQPRDENGQFTYNSANNKEISTETSRGHTLPPFLQGVELTFIKKGSEFQYKDDDKRLVRVISSIDMTADEMKAICMKYLKTEGGFAAIVGTAITKGGRRSSTAKEGTEGKLKNLDVSMLAQSTRDKIDAASKLEDKEWIKEQIAKMLSPKTVSKPKLPTYSETPKTPVGVGGSAKTEEISTPKAESSVIEQKNKLSNEKASQIKNVLSRIPELSEITEQDIIEMYEEGELTDEDLAELGTKI